MTRTIPEAPVAVASTGMETLLVVKSLPLNVALPTSWASCSHEWEIYGDGGDLGGNRTEVICRKCKCPGDFDEDHWEVVWPTT